MSAGPCGPGVALISLGAVPGQGACGSADMGIQPLQGPSGFLQGPWQGGPTIPPVSGSFLLPPAQYYLELGMCVCETRKTQKVEIR